MFQPLTGVFLFFAAFAINVPSAKAQYTNGIYAEFNTSMGSYTCRLEYALAPKAVANFIGLATGERAWLNASNGLAQTKPFYSGTTFHRVIAGIVIQGGSPNGLGTDGPGYQFVDEFTNSLRHDTFGMLSMANAGPDSNGAQFFLNVSPQPQWNDTYTIFGRLYGGSNVVYAISQVATDPNSKPLTNVVLQNVVVRRVGDDASAFNINAQGLPVVTNLNLKISPAGTNLVIGFSNQLSSNTRFYYGTNLFDWTEVNAGYATSLPLASAVVIGPTLPQQFWLAAQVIYPPTLYVPANVRNRALTLNVVGYGTFAIAFNNSGTGTYTWTAGSPGTIPGYTWIQDPYRGRFRLLFLSGFPPMELHLHFDSATSGTFKGTAYPNYPFLAGAFLVSGTFSMP